jgi:hypothetical protein
MKKGVGSEFIIQRYGSGDLDSHKNVADSQHCIEDALGRSHTAQQQQYYIKKWRENEECRVSG